MKKVVAINDLSGFGRCSLTVAIPILSALKLQCCPLPTAILSNQTQYPEYTFLDFTDYMYDYSTMWNKLNFNFDCIYSGFLGSENQINIVSNFIIDNSNSFIIVDPVMGDNGVLYPSFNESMCIKIKNLVKLANLTTPNLTEACFLSNREYKNSDFNAEELICMAKEISNLGPNQVVITGITRNDNILNLGYDKNTNKVFFTSVNYNGYSYSGTGDIFTSILCGLLNKGYNLELAMKEATNFIHKSINYTSLFDSNKNDGVMFEQFLSDLTFL